VAPSAPKDEFHSLPTTLRI